MSRLVVLAVLALALAAAAPAGAFRWLRHGLISYGNVFALTVKG